MNRARTRRARRAASIENILQAGLRLFVSQGYRATTAEDIAQAARLSKGSVFFYFENKEAVLLALLDRCEQLIVDQMIKRVEAAGPAAVDRLVAFVHGQAMLGIAKADYVLLFILMLAEFNGREGRVERRVKAIYRRFCKAVEDIIILGKATGTFRADLRTRELASVVVANHNGTLLEWYCRGRQLRGRQLRGSELVRALRQVLLEGILAPPAVHQTEAKRKRPTRALHRSAGSCRPARA